VPRLILLIVLCLAVPLQGLAAVVAAERVCPMQASMLEAAKALAQGVSSQAENLPDCCAGLLAAGGEGPACKCSQAAAALAWSTPVDQAAAKAPELQQYCVAWPTSSLMRAWPEGIWRPPAHG